jgi:hypothetical protein
MSCYEKVTDLNISDFDKVAIIAKLNHYLAMEAANDQDEQDEPDMSSGYLDKFETFTHKKDVDAVAFSISELSCLNDFAIASLAESSLAYILVSTIKDIYAETDKCLEIYYDSVERGDTNFYAEEFADEANLLLENLSFCGLAGSIQFRCRDTPFPTTIYFDKNNEFYSTKQI